MKRLCITILVALNICIVGGIVDLNSRTINETKIYKDLGNSVVNIYNGDKSGGSATFIADDLLLTAYHVVAEAGRYRVESDLIGKQDVHLYAAAPYADLAVMKIGKWKDGNKIKHDSLRMAMKTPDTGEKVFGRSNERLVEDIFSSGIITKNHTRDIYLIANTQVSQGSSGSALVNKDLEIIGVTSMLVRESSIRLYIDTDTTRKFVKDVLLYYYKHDHKRNNIL